MSSHLPVSGSRRINRGGCWGGGPQGARVADRDYDTSDYRDYYLGVRLIRRCP